MKILHSSHSTSDLVNTLSQVSAGSPVALFAKLFTSVCILTSFLGAGLCLTDFFSDGLQLEKKGMRNNMIIYAAVFLPPLIIVLFSPGVFIKALEYAGLDAVLLVVLLPAWMVWRGRYYKKIAKPGFKVPGG